MKAIRLFLFLFTGLALCVTAGAQEPDSKAKKKKSEKVTFTVNMYCENCKTKIEKNISWEKGVKDLTVTLEKKTVTIAYDPRKNTAEKLKEAIEKLGYTAEKHPDRITGTRIKSCPDK
ncbi:MAG: heavy-metal-associated domain-containing protein [Prevotellaceae bacterium]|nr:heavy-metal-associated domain-containing protein [Prevotellaceae bacterium]